MAELAEDEGPTLQLLFTEGWEAQKKVETGDLSTEENKVCLEEKMCKIFVNFSVLVV